MNVEFSDRITRVEPSATLAISQLAADLEAEGADVVDLSVGEPDFPTPENVREAGKDAIDAGHTGYTDSDGIADLRAAISEKLRDDGLDYGPENLIVTPGAKQALYETFQTLIDGVDGQSPSARGTESRAGDEVVLLDPAWVSYEAMAKLAGGDLTRVDLSEHDFSLEPALDDLAEAVSDETALIVVNSPSNPSGAVYSDEALKGVRDLAVEHDIGVIADEIYERISYERRPTPVASFEGMEERTVTINGFSKAYSMTGWRLGYLAAPEKLIDQTGKLQSHSVSCATNFVQRAGIEALENTETAVGQMVEAFEQRRDLVVDLLSDHGVEISPPAGAFYMMVPVEDDDQAWCEGALEDAHVATVPGSAFGTPGYARFSYANSEDRLREAIDRLANEGYL